MKNKIASPLVTIIIPIFNVEQYLEDCLKSLANQTYKNFEVLMIDDGSTDNSSKICKLFEKANSNFKYYYKENGGLSSARNYGINIAKGDYICLIDSDDYIDYDFLSNSVNTCLRTNADICFTDLIYVNDNGVVLEKDSPIANESFDRASAFLKLSLKQYHYYVCAVNRLYKASLFSDIRFPDGKLHEDEFIAHKLFDKASVFCSTNKSKYYYRQRDFSIMHSQISVKRFDAIEALIARFDYCKKNKYKECKKRSLNLAAVVLLDCLAGLDYIQHRRIFIKYMLKVYKPTVLRKMLLKLPWFYIKAVLRSYKYHLYLKKIERISKLNKVNCYLLGTPVHGNMGDQLIVQSEKEFLVANGFNKRQLLEIDNKLLLQCFDSVKKIVQKNDTVIIDGGGNLGDLWPWEDQKITRIIDAFSHNKIIIFPQTLFFKNKEASASIIKKNFSVYLKATKLHVFLRDISSFQLFKKVYPGINCYLCPDIVFYYKQVIKQNFSHKKDLGICFRTDKEKNDSRQINVFLEHIREINGEPISTIVNKKVTKLNRKKEIRKILKQFGTYKWVVTDRLHGMIISYITDTNCIAIDNISKKVSGSYNWIKDDDKIKLFSCFASADEALKALSENDLFSDDICLDYSNLSNILKDDLC